MTDREMDRQTDGQTDICHYNSGSNVRDKLLDGDEDKLTLMSERSCCKVSQRTPHNYKAPYTLPIFTGRVYGP